MLSDSLKWIDSCVITATRAWDKGRTSLSLYLSGPTVLPPFDFSDQTSSLPLVYFLGFPQPALLIITYCPAARNVICPDFRFYSTFKMRLTYIRCCDSELDRMLDLRSNVDLTVASKNGYETIHLKSLVQTLARVWMSYTNRNPIEMGGRSLNG